MKKIFFTIIPIFILLFSLGVWLIVSESYLSRKIQNLVNSFLNKTNNFDDNATDKWAKFFLKYKKP